MKSEAEVVAINLRGLLLSGAAAFALSLVATTGLLLAVLPR